MSRTGKASHIAGPACRRHTVNSHSAAFSSNVVIMPSENKSLRQVRRPDATTQPCSCAKLQTNEKRPATIGMQWSANDPTYSPRLLPVMLLSCICGDNKQTKAWVRLRPRNDIVGAFIGSYTDDGSTSIQTSTGECPPPAETNLTIPGGACPDNDWPAHAQACQAGVPDPEKVRAWGLFLGGGRTKWSRQSDIMHKKTAQAGRGQVMGRSETERRLCSDGCSTLS